MQFAVVLAMSLIGFATGQNRPFYAPRPFIYPAVLNPTNPNDNLENRFAEGGASTSGFASQAPQQSRPTVVTGPILSFSGSPTIDNELIDRVSNLPADKQPFWYVNREAIQQHISNTNPSATFNAPAPQSSFVSRG